ncbi:MAG: histidine kinase dimerization/phospho-acceptor domain-containing protein, partial [Pseudomonadota bacterium]
MSQKNQPAQPDPPKRFQDFFVLTSGAIAVLALLFLTGAIGLVEWVIGAVVMTAGALAFYVGSAPTPQKPSPAPVLETPPTPEGQRPDISVEPFILALPLPALLISRDGQIVTANTHARSLFRFEPTSLTFPVAVLRQPDLLDAAERVARDGANERVEFTQHGDAEVWMAHVRPGPDTGSVIMVFEDLTAVRRAERARADFLANASHELRTPLSTLIGFIETLRGPAREDADARERFLGIMEEQAGRMSR